MALLGFVGFAGMHRFYLGRPLTGLLWLFTGGLCGLGTLMDLVFMPGLLRDANEQREH
jgi:TM2 domain-containing membrane protein YozV